MPRTLTAPAVAFHAPFLVEPVLKRCFFCRLRFRGNEVLEHFSSARTIAYDPERGRLWAICQGCSRWTLTPFDSRWEALEELERSAGAFRVTAKTDNVSLLRGPGIEVVRIGSAAYRESAWWRYGRRLIRRRFVSLSLGVGLGGAVVVGPAILLGAAAGPVFSITAPYLVALSQFAPAALKTARFGWSGWRSPLRCLRCGELFRSLSYYQMRRLRVVPGKRAGELGVRVPCPRCRKKGVQLNAAEAELFVRRYLAHHNLFGAWSRRIEAAAAQIESLHTTGALISRLTHDRTIISTVDSTTVLALEMAMNDESERALLALKATDLEARWREAEVIAAIADGELTPVTV